MKRFKYWIFSCTALSWIVDIDDWIKWFLWLFKSSQMQPSKWSVLINGSQPLQIKDRYVAKKFAFKKVKDDCELEINSKQVNSKFPFES